MKTLITLALSILLVGCSTSNPTGTVNPIVVRLGVSTGVSYGLAKYPQALPGVKVAGEVICSAAANSTLSPSNLVAAIQGASTNVLPETTLIVNGALVLYIGIWNSYGQAALTNHPALKQYLQATCDGINDGLRTPPRATKAVAGTKWPLLTSE